MTLRVLCTALMVAAVPMSAGAMSAPKKPGASGIVVAVHAGALPERIKACRGDQGGFGYLADPWCENGWRWKSARGATAWRWYPSTRRIPMLGRHRTILDAER